MTSVAPLLLWIGTLGACDTPHEDELRNERRRLGGTWIVDSILHDAMERAEGKGFKVVIIGEKVIVKVPGEEEAVAGLIIKINPAKQPRALDIWIDETSFGKSRKVTFKEPPLLAIYELSVDTLRVCWAPPESRKRPTEFSAKAGTQHGLLVLKRDKS